jgi:hypothetical protein
MKICTKCKENKQYNEFHKDFYSKSGLKSFCKECANSYYKNNRKLVSEREKVYRKENFEAIKKRNKSYRLANPELFTSRRRRIENRFTKLKSAAAQKNRQVDLTFEQYKELVEDKKCTYCEGNLPTCGGGLDRIDNSKGYTKDNVTPCCTSCNTIRGNKLTYEQMKKISSILKEFRLENSK